MERYRQLRRKWPITECEIGDSVVFTTNESIEKRQAQLHRQFGGRCYLIQTSKKREKKTSGEKEFEFPL